MSSTKARLEPSFVSFSTLWKTVSSLKFIHVIIAQYFTVALGSC